MNNKSWRKLDADLICDLFLILINLPWNHCEPLTIFLKEIIGVNRTDVPSINFRLPFKFYVLIEKNYRLQRLWKNISIFFISADRHSHLPTQHDLVLTEVLQIFVQILIELVQPTDQPEHIIQGIKINNLFIKNIFL